jgi:hypothetical protein
MTDALYNSAFLKACRGEKTDYTPIWLNRQAGRYMPEYHQVKGNTPSLDFFKTPALAAKVTCDAQRILGVDAAIMFADLLPILEPMGLVLDYIPGVGPQFENPVRSHADIDALRIDPSKDTMPYSTHWLRWRALYVGFLCHRRQRLAQLCPRKADDVRRHGCLAYADDEDHGCCHRLYELSD